MKKAIILISLLATVFAMANQSHNKQIVRSADFEWLYFPTSNRVTNLSAYNYGGASSNSNYNHRVNEQAYTSILAMYESYFRKMYIASTDIIDKTNKLAETIFDGNLGYWPRGGRTNISHRLKFPATYPQMKTIFELYGNKGIVSPMYSKAALSGADGYWSSSIAAHTNASAAVITPIMDPAALNIPWRNDKPEDLSDMQIQLFYYALPDVWQLPAYEFKVGDVSIIATNTIISVIPGEGGWPMGTQPTFADAVFYKLAIIGAADFSSWWADWKKDEDNRLFFKTWKSYKDCLYDAFKWRVDWGNVVNTNRVVIAEDQPSGGSLSSGNVTNPGIGGNNSSNTNVTITTSTNYIMGTVSHRLNANTAAGISQALAGLDYFVQTDYLGPLIPTNDMPFKAIHGSYSCNASYKAKSILPTATNLTETSYYNSTGYGQYQQKLTIHEMPLEWELVSVSPVEKTEQIVYEKAPAFEASPLLVTIVGNLIPTILTNKSVMVENSVLRDIASAQTNNSINVAAQIAYTPGVPQPDDYLDWKQLIGQDDGVPIDVLFYTGWNPVEYPNRQYSIYTNIIDTAFKVWDAIGVATVHTEFTYNRTDELEPLGNHAQLCPPDDEEASVKLVFEDVWNAGGTEPYWRIHTRVAAKHEGDYNFQYATNAITEEYKDIIDFIPDLLYAETGIDYSDPDSILGDPNGYWKYVPQEGTNYAYVTTWLVPHIAERLRYEIEERQTWNLSISTPYIQMSYTIIPDSDGIITEDSCSGSSVDNLNWHGYTSLDDATDYEISNADGRLMVDIWHGSQGRLGAYIEPGISWNPGERKWTTNATARVESVWGMREEVIRPTVLISEGEKIQFKREREGYTGDQVLYIDDQGRLIFCGVDVSSIDEVPLYDIEMQGVVEPSGASNSSLDIRHQWIEGEQISGTAGLDVIPVISGFGDTLKMSDD